MTEYIEREAAYKSLLREAAHLCWNLKDAESRGYIGAAQTIKNIPAADVAPVRRGRWVPVYESEISGWKPEYAGYDPVGDYRCSVCGKDTILDCNDEFLLSPFCPNCGCEMDGGEENA